jgi:GntR family transcriptional regulator/MocR family aminotransferase
MTPTPGERPVFVRLADALRDGLRQGLLLAGEALPSTRELGAHLGIHRHTVRAALDQLVTEGWLEVEQRRGYVVGAAPDAARSGPTAHKFRFADMPEMAPFAPADALRFNFQSGLPDLRLFPVDELRACMAEALREATPALLDYSHPSGWPRLKTAIARYLLEQRGLSPREIVVTNGSQEAVYLAMRLLVRPGDDVAVEALTYPPARETLRLVGAHVHALPLDEHGLHPDGLARLAKKSKLRLLFLTPTHQFPTTRNLAAERRLRILQIAAEHRIPIIEDDYDHEFHYDAAPPRPLAALDDRGLVLYVSTFSKVVFPSTRLAFLAAPAAFTERLCQLRRLTSHQNDSLVQDAMARWMESGGYQRHMRRMRRAYEERRDAMDAALTAARAEVPALRWESPSGGMATWVDTGQESDDVERRARAAGIFVSAEAGYRVRRGSGSHVRLGFAHLEPPEIAAAVAALAAVLKTGSKLAPPPSEGESEA